MGISRDGECTEWGVQEIGSSVDGSARAVELRSLGVHEMRSSGDWEFSRWEVHEIGSSGHGV